MIRVLLAEDMRILREALAGLLALEDDIEVVAALAGGAEIVPTALRVRPDVAVIDIELPGLDGLSAAAELHERMPGCRTLILTGVGRPGNLRRARDAHVSGFMVKDSPAADLAGAIRTVAAGGLVVDPQLAFAALEASGSPLTDRETEVLRLTAAGGEPPEIAAQIGLSYGTVRNYLASAVAKLSARNRVDAIRIATEAGWI
ncbi:response regulator transcription factor [Actinomadura mexicana]|uniref:Two component transcriptional regulator, LuxR family n=1 Tax=Actinomadura mexicana TaxID=134959 RepID=A0A238WQ79_9ACTN|nr:response regulator transcription factor [Actinomadura mexicana]SNR48685.1 two component transcriptional regulator, LuxR family [Actinomadura mexicana]